MGDIGSCGLRTVCGNGDACLGVGGGRTWGWENTGCWGRTSVVGVKLWPETLCGDGGGICTLGDEGSADFIGAGFLDIGSAEPGFFSREAPGLPAERSS